MTGYPSDPNQSFIITAADQTRYTQSPPSSVDASDAQDTTVTCADILAYDEDQVLQYLKEQDRVGNYDALNIVGIRSLSSGKRDELTEKINKAASLLPLSIVDLDTRLQNVASRQNGPPDLKPIRSPSPSSEGTPPPPSLQVVERSYRQELVRNGGRPVCTIEEQSQILAAPMDKYEIVMPWLSDVPDSEDGIGELKTLFTRQFTRWWDFRKLQWEYRGLSENEAGCSAFLEASRRRFQGEGSTAFTSSPSFTEMIRRGWQRMPSSGHPKLKYQTFAAYSNSVKIRLAPHHFGPSLQLRKDPQKQTAWTNWLEYLSFELSCLERWTAIADSREPKYHESTRRLLAATQSGGDTAPNSLAMSTSTQTQNSRLALNSKTRAESGRDQGQRPIDDFLADTKDYTRARRIVMYQRYRVEWAIKEARLLENEMSEAKSLAKSRKRKQDDEEPLEPQSKRLRNEDGASNLVTNSARQLRSGRLVHIKQA